MTEQLSLFTIAPSQISAPIHDPYWDEIECDNVDSLSFKTNKRDFKIPLTELGAATHPIQLPEIAPQHIQQVNNGTQVSTVQILVGAQVTSNTQTNTVESLVGAQVKTDTKKVAPQHDTHWVEKYWVQRGGNKYWYYRYCWMSGRKKNRLYIGSAQSAIAKNRKLEVEIAIADGQTPGEIKNLLRSWKT